MGWIKVTGKWISKRDDAACMALFEISHANNYATGGGTALDFGKMFKEVGYAQVIDGKGFSLVADKVVGSDTALKIRVHYYDYNNAADGPTIEYPDATSLTVTKAIIMVVGRVRDGKYEPAMSADLI